MRLTLLHYAHRAKSSLVTTCSAESATASETYNLSHVSVLEFTALHQISLCVLYATRYYWHI